MATTVYRCPATLSMRITSASVDEVNTITSHATTPATAGTFTLTVEGQTTAGIAYNATAADVQAALEALSNVAVGDVTVVATAESNLGAPLAIVTINWTKAMGGKDLAVSANFGGLTGNPHVLATPTQGFTGVSSRIRPQEAFAFDPAVSAQANAFLAAGFDHTQHVSFGGATVSGADSWVATNPYKVS